LFLELRKSSPFLRKSCVEMRKVYFTGQTLLLKYSNFLPNYELVNVGRCLSVIFPFLIENRV